MKETADMRIALALFIFLISFNFSLPVIAQEGALDSPQRYVKMRLLEEKGQIAAGEEIWIGLEQSIHPGWHTYWQNPGDSGAAPNIKWSLPEGFEVSDIHWPVPKKLPYGPLLNYGYEGNVILLQKLIAPDSLPEGPLTLKADIDILVCEVECIPEYGSYKITLNSGGMPEDNSAYLAAAREKLPKSLGDGLTAYNEKNGDFIVRMKLSENISKSLKSSKSIALFPIDWGLVENTAKPEISLEKDTLIIRQARGDRDISALNGDFRGVIAVSLETGTVGYEFKATQAGIFPSPGDDAVTPAKPETSFLSALFLALLGGIVLNLMPCVFPVLSIKALSLCKTAEKSAVLARLHGFSYSAGIVLSFLLIAGVLIGLKAAGAQIGWGFQLQNPIVITLLVYLLFVIGLNLSGFFEFGGRFINLGGRLTQNEGLGGSFFTGVLAAIVATPCTAPFMAVAIGYALLQPASISLAVFAALGFGLALPYLILSFVPAVQRALPRPGAWMETFKQFLAFPMYASAAWLVWVLSQQAGPIGVLGALMGLVFITFALWLLKLSPETSYWQAKTKILALAAIAAAFFLLPAGEMGEKATENPTTIEKAFGQPYSAEKLSLLLESNAPVFVEMTAAWCITCKVNHATSINIQSTRDLFSEQNVEYLIGDWTNQDPEITKYLDSFGRNGVPIYVYYGSPDSENGERPEPVVLPQILTPGIVARTVRGS